MWLRSIVDRVRSARLPLSAELQRRSVRRKPAACRLSLEPLEQRNLPSFMAPVQYASGRMTYDSVATADFNGDGRLDFAVHSDMGGIGVSVLLANGDGTFGPVRSFSAATSYMGPQSLAAGDFNADGWIDLAAANANDTVSILLGRGDGTFAAPINRLLTAAPISLTTGDVNGDGMLDLAVGAQDFYGEANFGQYLYVLLGNGDGTFASQISHALPPDADIYAHPSTVRLADLNGDGKADVVAARMFNTLNVLLGNGDGTLGPVATFATGPAPTVWSRSVAIGDLNADGHLDLVAADANGTTVSVLPGNGTGAFPTYQTHTVGSNPYSVEVADLNRDGRLDIVTANIDGHNVSVLLGKADGSLQSTRNYPAGPRAFSLAVGNFNSDSFPDVVVTNGATQYLSLLVNDGNWLASGPPSIRISDVTRAEGQKDTTYFYFTVTLSSSSDVAVTVNFATADGTAKVSNGDYTATSGTLIFAPGETTKTIAVAVKTDRKKEANETFFVNLTGAVNATIFDGQGIGSILNDD